MTGGGDSGGQGRRSEQDAADGTAANEQRNERMSGGRGGIGTGRGGAGRGGTGGGDD